MPRPNADEAARRPGDLPKSRLDGFADGVLAIVITLLVLELKVPGVEESGDLFSALTGEWREYAGYLISFVFVGGVWIAHSAATSYVVRGDAILFRLNLLLLFFVSLLPFLTSVMTTHLGQEGERVAVALYGLDLFVASAVLSAFIRYAGHHPRLVSGDLADEDLRRIEHERRVLVATLGASAVVALLVPNLAVTLYLLAALGFIVAPLVMARRKRHELDARAQA
jgi:uncharacterized membrane protein